ncbi:hypothetical protein BH24CHL6_BH24CHL6_11850 [soil metagenome]
MALPPWDYLNRQFIRENFPDLFDPLWIAALVFLVLTVVLYNVRTRQLHRHEPLRTLQEWLLWTGLSVFGLLLVATVFRFYFFVVVGTLVVGIAVFVWIRFRRFPPIVELYNGQLKRARFFSQSRYKNPEATVRSRRTRGQRRRR